MTWKRSDTTKPLEDLILWNDSKRLILKPYYQREIIWKPATQRRLIWCMLRDHDIPKFYLHVKPQKRGGPIYEVIDGQQRLFTIFQFLADELRLSADADSIDGIEVRRKFYRDLPDELASRFRSYKMTICEIETDEEDRVRQQFLDLQSGVPLNPQEVREATRCAYKDATIALQQHPFCERLKSQRGSAGRNVRLWIARVLSYELAGRLTDTSGRLLDDLYLQSAIGTLPDKEVRVAQTRVGEMLTALNAALKGCQLTYTTVGTHLYWQFHTLLDEGIDPTIAASAIRSWYIRDWEKVQPEDRRFWTSAHNSIGPLKERQVVMRKQIAPYLPQNGRSHRS